MYELFRIITLLFGFSWLAPLLAEDNGQIVPSPGPDNGSIIP